MNCSLSDDFRNQILVVKLLTISIRYISVCTSPTAKFRMMFVLYHFQQSSTKIINFAYFVVVFADFDQAVSDSHRFSEKYWKMLQFLEISTDFHEFCEKIIKDLETPNLRLPKNN